MPKKGQYVFRLKRGYWRICIVTEVFSNDTCSGYGIKTFDNEPSFPYADRNGAVRRVYELNGWKIPKGL